MEFFDDPSLFVGGLEGLDEDEFPSAPSLVDELNLSADFEPLHQVEPLGPGKPPDIMPPISTQQVMPAYVQPMDHYIGIKGQNITGQTFSGHRGTGAGGGSIMPAQHGQYHNAAMSQVPQSNGLFCNSSSPMWGNQDQNGNMFHPVSQQQQHPQQQRCHQQQQLHNQQLNVRQHIREQQHQPCHDPQQEQQHRMRQQLQQQQSHQQQLLNQCQSQQINTQTMSLQQQQHHNFSFHQGSQQVHHSQLRAQHQLSVGGQRFQSRALPNKSYLDGQNASLSGTCLQQHQQQHGSYRLTSGGQAFSGSGLEDPNRPFPMHSSSMVLSLPTCSVSSAPAYQLAQYPAYPGEPEVPTLNQQSLSTASVSGPTLTTNVSLTSTVSELSGTVCQFPSTGVMNQQHTKTSGSQEDECPFRALHCSGETQGSSGSSEMFGESMSCYPTMAIRLPSEQPQSCGAINTNGYQALGDGLLTSEAQDGDLEGLEPPDLLPDLLPQLEVALSQQDESNCSWASSSFSSSLERGHEHRKPPPVEYKEEKVIKSLYIFDPSKLQCIANKWLDILAENPLKNHSLCSDLYEHSQCTLSLTFSGYQVRL